jgi:hypothetical protein
VLKYLTLLEIASIISVLVTPTQQSVSSIQLTLLFSVTPQILVPTLASTCIIPHIFRLYPTVALPVIRLADIALLPTSYNLTSPMPTAAFPAFQVVMLIEVAAVTI